MNLQNLRDQEISKLVDRVKTGDRRVLLQAWKEARAKKDDFLSDRLRYALCGGTRPVEQTVQEPQQSYTSQLLKKVVDLYKENVRQPSEFMAYA